KGLPLYITAPYTIYQASLAEKEVCLLVPRSNENTFTPDQLSKQMEVVVQKTGLPAIFVFNRIVSYNISRLVKKRVNFIVPGKQLYIPSLMIHLQKAADKPPKEAVIFTPVAQSILLYHLQKDLLNGHTAKQLAEILLQTYRTVSRAIKNLADFDLISFTGGKEKQICFNFKGRILWEKSLRYLQNPVERTVYTDETFVAGDMRLSNINALSHYTMLNDESKQYYAIYKKDIKSISDQTNNYFGSNHIEVWRYDPKVFSNDNYVDKLSLYLLLKDDEDERVQGALEQMINEMKWLED
ncbi:MAG: hypothetical protein Q8910_19655, partial [Bacteroidota bacterium]|nr:hypothetical protein [Bacteroidota bacterium]